MKPVISANMLPVQAALRASSSRPSRSAHSITAASTGVGLFQCVQPQAGQRRRVLRAAVLQSRGEPLPAACAQCGQKRYAASRAQAGNTPVDR